MSNVWRITMNLKIIVATHKPYSMPIDDMYVPVYVGNKYKNTQDDKLLSYIGDDTGDNISEKNPYYCELTALYWAWKNLNYDYLGLVHYRRYFEGRHSKYKFSSIADKPFLEKKFQNYSVILPRKRSYFIETTYSQYVHAHNKQDLDMTFEIIKTFYPEYIDAWHKVMKSTSGHRFNMFIMRRDILDSYLTWLFDILFKLEECLDISEYSDNDKRVFGFVSERLLDVWLITNHIEYTELPVVYMEKVDWPKKICAFLKRKFIGK